MEACGKCQQKQVSEFIVTKHNMTNQILSVILDWPVFYSEAINILQQLTIRDTLAVSSHKAELSSVSCPRSVQRRPCSLGNPPSPGSAFQFPASPLPADPGLRTLPPRWTCSWTGKQPGNQKVQAA